ncbi:hypothetical protein [Nocardia fusca]|uniref:hypothetical protein n=1 Tax=Nocardia fusca TaxID=941183 RepID=UPI000A87E4DE|nr:hypothetical protein [Nocardia fusca]
MVSDTNTHRNVEDRARSDAAQISPAESRMLEAISKIRIDTEIDRDAGWPPRLKRATAGSAALSAYSDRYVSPSDIRSSLEVALYHPEVEEYLKGRWEVLGCQPFARRRNAHSIPRVVHVAIFNYTTNQLIEISVEDEQVISIEEKEAHESPEAPIEIAQATAVARAHPTLRGKIDGLAAHGILQVPPEGSSQGHRCILVMFTEQDDLKRELPVLYSAVVDLNLQSVILSGAAPPCRCVPTSVDRESNS